MTNRIVRKMLPRGEFMFAQYFHEYFVKSGFASPVKFWNDIWGPFQFNKIVTNHIVPEDTYDKRMKSLLNNCIYRSERTVLNVDNNESTYE